MLSIIACRKDDYATLAEIWERSVRATHGFLTESVIQEIKAALIPDYFPCVDLYAASSSGTLVGFIGLRFDKIEMLFIDAHARGLGYGTALTAFAKKKGAVMVDVNLQNTDALKFYQAMGFRIIGCDETDDAGRPYPILHLSL